MTNNKLKGLDIPKLKHKKVYTQEYVDKLERENRLLGERCNQLLKDKGDLTDRLSEEVELHLHAEEYIKKLEKENAELKNIKDVADLIRLNNSSIVAMACLNNHNTSLHQELTQAKEIIKNLLILKNDHFGNTKMEWRVEVTEQAEQFLKGENVILEDAQAGNSPFDADEVFNKEMKAYPEEK
jgi:hypothetical protein